MIRVLLFDLDGTALDSEPDFTAVLNRMLAAEDRSAIAAAQVRSTIADGARAVVSLLHSEAEPEFDATLTRFLAAYEQQVQHSIARFFPGMEALLDTLTSKHLRWGIVTNKSRRFTLPLLASHPAFADSAVTVCADEVSHSKPAPDSLLLACRRLDCRPDDCFYIGDHPRDIVAGQRAGMRTIAAGWGYLPAAGHIEDWGADHCVAHPLEILSLLDK